MIFKIESFRGKIVRRKYDVEVFNTTTNRMQKFFHFESKICQNESVINYKAES